MSINVLIVDDSDVIRAMIARTLSLADLPLAQVLEASNGREAPETLEDTWIDLVLADINMPIMDGAEMLTTMRRRPATQDVPVVVVSTEGASERIDSLMRLGVAAWIRKPFTPEEIRDVVERVLRDAEQRAVFRDTLDETLAMVLEQFAFSFPEPLDDQVVPEPGDDLMVARISFVGAAVGSLTLAAPAALCAELAANVLGCEPGEDAARLQGADTLGEILNMACGHIATRIDAERATNIQPPIVTRLPRTEWDRLADSSGARCYLIEERPLVALLGIRPPVLQPDAA